jgi:hypothetical protein
MSELNGAVAVGELDGAVSDQVSAPAQCDCGRPAKHRGQCRGFVKKRQDSPIVPEIKMYFFCCEGDHIKLNLTGGNISELQNSMKIIGRAFGFDVSFLGEAKR